MSAFDPGDLAISCSQLRAYQSCPRAYEFRYVRGEKPAFVPLPLAFGTSIHHALAVMFDYVRNFRLFPELKAVEQAFADEWAKASHGDLPLRAGDGEEVDVGEQLDGGVRLLRAFHAHVAGSAPPEVVGAEVPFTVDLNDPTTGEVLDVRLRGVIDLITREDGRVVIQEHKTAARRYGQDELRFSSQPTAYQIAAREMGLGEVGLRFNVLVKTKTPGVQVEDVRRDELDERFFIEVVTGTLKAISAGAFPPVRSWACRSCPFAEICEKPRRFGIQ